MSVQNIRQVIATFEKTVRGFIREHPEIVSITITLPNRKAALKIENRKSKIKNVPSPNQT